MRFDLTFTLVFVARVVLIRASGGIQDSGSRPCATSQNACDRCAWARAGHHAAFIASGGAHLALQSGVTLLVYPRQIPQPPSTRAHKLIVPCFPARLTVALLSIFLRAVARTPAICYGTCGAVGRRRRAQAHALYDRVVSFADGLNMIFICNHRRTLFEICEMPRGVKALSLWGAYCRHDQASEQLSSSASVTRPSSRLRSCLRRTMTLARSALCTI